MRAGITRACGSFDDGDIPARGDGGEWPWRGEFAGRDGWVSALKCSGAAGDAVDGLMMIDCSAQSKIKNAFGYAIQGFAGFFQAR